MISQLRKTYVQARLSLLFLGLGLALVSYVQVRALYLDGTNIRKKETALVEIKRLLVLTIQYSKSHSLPAKQNVWQEFGFSSPSLDPWGSPYQMEVGINSVLWRSAGPDKSYGTADDIFLRIPVNNTVVPDSVEPPPVGAAPAVGAQ